jgi:hypothetical protein
MKTHIPFISLALVLAASLGLSSGSSQAASPASTVDNPDETETSLSIAPYPAAPLCPDTGAAHDPSLFHTIWDSTRGCHYDHEHGKNPFTPEMQALFPGFDLHALLGGVEIGHTNPSSPMENTMKHGGFKWQVGRTPQGCVRGFEGARYCVAAFAIQYHNFGDYSMELEGRIHSTAALLKVCDPARRSNCGYIYVVQFQDYGQRVSPYQGDVLLYPDNPIRYGSGLGPYVSVDCVGLKAGGLRGRCRSRLEQIRSMNLNTNSIWTSKGGRTAPSGSKLFKLLFRVRDTYQVVKWNDDGSIPSYPFTFLYACGGETYNPLGCRYNNSASMVHEVAGTIPASWDGSSFDQDPRPRRVTAEGYVTRFGQWNPACTGPSVEADCFPIKMVGMFVGNYGSELSRSKVSNATPSNTPERDIYFCNGIPCSERSPGALPSGWIGGGN